jgi:hypothetical protein
MAFLLPLDRPFIRSATEPRAHRYTLSGLLPDSLSGTSQMCRIAQIPAQAAVPASKARIKLTWPRAIEITL